MASGEEHRTADFVFLPWLQRGEGHDVALGMLQEELMESSCGHGRAVRWKVSDQGGRQSRWTPVQQEEPLADPPRLPAHMSTALDQEHSWVAMRGCACGL